MLEKIKDWIVTAYDIHNNIIATWAINNRTEGEAVNEAIADLPYNTDDWSLVENLEVYHVT